MQKKPIDNSKSETDQPPSSFFTRAVNFLYERFGTRLLKNKNELIDIFDEAQESGLMDEEARDTMQRVLLVSSTKHRPEILHKLGSRAKIWCDRRGQKRVDVSQHS